MESVHIGDEVKRYLRTENSDFSLILVEAHRQFEVTSGHL